uniref:LTD domain-containing protein n=1 Tax=Leptobrachium leishanense TaxID=445787 RepID=A0A8C5MZW1_9ANUR
MEQRETEPAAAASCVKEGCSCRSSKGFPGQLEEGPVCCWIHSPPPSKSKGAMQRKCQDTQGRPTATSAEKGIYSSAPCPLKIVEVNGLGHFIRIFNSSHLRVDLSGYILWQLEGNYPVTMYRFPQNIILPASQHITVWSSATKISHNPPTDLVWKGRIYFRSDKHCVTVLSRPSGQPVAFYTAYDLPPPCTPKSQRASLLQESIQRHSSAGCHFANAFSKTEIPRNCLTSAIPDLFCRRFQSVSYRSSRRQNPPMTPTLSPENCVTWSFKQWTWHASTQQLGLLPVACTSPASVFNQ